MPNLGVSEIKAFVPAKDFELSKRFYTDIGFTMASDGGGVAYFHLGHASFLLQNFCTGALAENFMMHLLVRDVEAWWKHISDCGVVAKYGVTLSGIELQPWRMRDFCLTDPSGVLWRIGQNVQASQADGTDEEISTKVENANIRLHVSNSDVSRSNFDNTMLRSISFTNVDMAESRINDANLTGAQMTNVNLTDVSISNGKFSGMTIDGILVTDLLSVYRSRP